MASHRKAYIIDIAILVIVAIILAITMAFSRAIEFALGLSYYKTVDVTAGDTGEGDGFVSDDGQLKVNFIDVGQGDCTIIQLPDGKAMIIDAGKGNKSVKASIDNFIDENFDESFKYFDYAILTHPDDDHCGSWAYVLNKYPARVCYRPNVEATKDYTDPAGSLPKKKETAAYRDAVKAMYKQIDGEPNTVYITDPKSDEQTIVGEDNSYTFTFYSPLSEVYTDWNDYSPIMILSYKGFNFAISGDAEKTNESEFAEKVKSARTDGVTDKYDIFTDSYTVNLIKCGHHGSRTSTSQAYIDAITTPEGAQQAYYIISCGEGNSYKHPHKETLNRLKDMGVPDDNVLRTDILGTITISVRMDANGNYNLFYGNVAKKSVLTYNKIGNIDLTWPLVAWVGYAVLVIVVALHAAGLKFFGGGSDGGRGKRR
ncbi:MAG: MBL fold metallo-hydrolase [Clostridiales bacterium]|nr:MBL fold metallo-hydrolase [Clostridiales bacterium]